MEILRDSWYIKDQIRPSLGREVHCKLEALTNKSILKIPTIPEMEVHITGMRVYGINLGRELTFFKDKQYLLIDLGDLGLWTSTPNPKGLIRVLLDVRFTMQDPYFELSSWDLGYKSLFEMDGYRLDKGVLIIPPGLKLKNEKIELEISYGFKDAFYLETRPDYITKEGKFRKYEFYLDQKTKDYFKSDQERSTFKIVYQTVNEKKYYLISFIGISLLLVAFFRFYAIITADPNLQFDIRFLAASITFLGLFLGLVREGYELPFRRLIFISIIILVFDLGLELVLWK